jgi:hypothetical protein
MRDLCWVLACAGSFWLAAGVATPEAAAQPAPSNRAACTAEPGRALSPACRHSGFVASRRRAASDVHVHQAQPRSRRLLYPPRIASDFGVRQSARSSTLLFFRSSAGLPQSRPPKALRMTQIPRASRASAPAPHPLFITRPCFTRFADALGCPSYSRSPTDPLVDALLQAPNPRTVPVLRALGLPIIPDVPPIVILERE